MGDFFVSGVGKGDSRQAIEGVVIERERVAILIRGRSDPPNGVVGETAGVVAAGQGTVHCEQVAIGVIGKLGCVAQRIGHGQHLATGVVAEARRLASAIREGARAML